MALGFAPAFRRHHSEQPVSEATALAAAAPTGLGSSRCISSGTAQRWFNAFHASWVMTFAGYRQRQQRKETTAWRLWGVVTDPQLVVKGLMEIVNRCNVNSQTQWSLAPLSYLFLPLPALLCCCRSFFSDVSMFSQSQEPWIGKKKRKEKKMGSSLSSLHSPSVLRNTLPHSVPPESCCLLSVCCSWAEVLPPPPQMASGPRGTPGLREGRKAEGAKKGETWEGKREIIAMLAALRVAAWHWFELNASILFHTSGTSATEDDDAVFS